MRPQFAIVGERSPVPAEAAMASTLIDDDGPGFDEVIAKRDALLALV